MKPDRIGVVPYVVRDGRIQVVIVSSRDGARWVLPKGKPKPEMSRRRLASLEAWEEAGVRGAWAPRRPIDVELVQHGRSLRMRLFPLEVSRLARRYPEQGDRQRRLVGLDEARDLLGKRIGEALDALAQRLGSS